eukprot:gene2569-2608_t
MCRQYTNGNNHGTLIVGDADTIAVLVKGIGQRLHMLPYRVHVLSLETNIGMKDICIVSNKEIIEVHFWHFDDAIPLLRYRTGCPDVFVTDHIDILLGGSAVSGCSDVLFESVSAAFAIRVAAGFGRASDRAKAA